MSLNPEGQFSDNLDKVMKGARIMTWHEDRGAHPGLDCFVQWMPTWAVNMETEAAEQKAIIKDGEEAKAQAQSKLPNTAGYKRTGERVL